MNMTKKEARETMQEQLEQVELVLAATCAINSDRHNWHALVVLKGLIEFAKSGADSAVELHSKGTHCMGDAILHRRLSDRLTEARKVCDSLRADA